MVPPNTWNRFAIARRKTPARAVARVMRARYHRRCIALTFPQTMNPTSIFFAQACLVVGTPLLLWRGLRMGGIVPLVVMQIVGGILLGPSLLGALLAR